MANSDPFAAYARGCIKATLGVDVECWDQEGRQGAYDLRYVHGGQVVAIEVKRVVKESYRKAEQAEADIGYTRDERLSRRWHLRLDQSARWKSVRQAVPELIREIELAGWEHHPLWRLESADRHMYQKLKSLKVTAMWSDPPTDQHPPGFLLMRRGSAGFDRGVDYLVEFACEKLTGKEGDTLRRQLGNANATERHAFLFIGDEEYIEETAPLRSSSEELPSSPPRLPTPVDGLWLTGDWAGARLIAWLPDRGWLNGTGPPW